jgi:hypothetical protein
MANIHKNAETFAHQEPFSVKIVDVLALFCIFSAFHSEIVLIFAPLELKTI